MTRARRRGTPTSWARYRATRSRRRGATTTSPSRLSTSGTRGTSDSPFRLVFFLTLFFFLLLRGNFGCFFFFPRLRERIFTFFLTLLGMKNLSSRVKCKWKSSLKSYPNRYCWHALWIVTLKLFSSTDLYREPRWWIVEITFFFQFIVRTASKIIP